VTTLASFSERAVRDTDRGEIRDGDARYMMIRADALMGLFRNLDDDARNQALAALADSILEHGGRSAKMYQSMDLGLGEDEARKLLSVIEGTAPELGWGRWSFARDDAGSLTLSVGNSPFVAGFGDSEVPVCAGALGMFAAVSSLVLGRELSTADVEEHSCAAVTGDTHCRFSVR